MSQYKVDAVATMNRQQKEIERLQERCEAYKGQVKAGSAEIERLKAVIARWEKNFASTSLKTTENKNAD